MRENFIFLLSVIAIVFAFTFELPYVIYTPGGSIDLSERITVEGGYESSGSFQMAYVSMMKGNIPFVLLSLLVPNWDLVRTSDLKPANESLDEMIESDRISMKQAQDNAVFAAFSLAGKEVLIESLVHHIVYISEDADTDLELFDELVSVNGQDIEDLESLQREVSKFHEGDEITFLVKADGEEKERHARVYQTEDGLKVGISITTTYEYKTDPHIEISTKNSESGPSGGLMMALSIYNSIVEEDITHGKIIIGTGTIDQEGHVGKIGGVKYKLLGASKKKADIFLVPEENYEEAIAVKKEENLDIRVISVSTLKEAIEAIR